MDDSFEVRSEGLYFKPGDFYIDAQLPVPLCLVTHAHGDHARPGHQHYIATRDSLEILHLRLGKEISIQTFPYDKKFKLKDSWVSFHPSGHILGSAQIRIETNNRVFVVSGDYKRVEDKTCSPFVPIECDLFVTESTFALTIYRWESNEVIAKEIFDWWEENSHENHPSVLFCYPLGKAQRILSLLKHFVDRPIFLHGAMLPIAQIYAQKGIDMLPFLAIGDRDQKKTFQKELILAPPSAAGSLWLKKISLISNSLCFRMDASAWNEKKKRNGSRVCPFRPC